MRFTKLNIDGYGCFINRSLELEPGQYRLRARLSDDFNEIVGDKYIDLTVGEERIAPGFVEIAPPPGQEVGQQAPSSD